MPFDRNTAAPSRPGPSPVPTAAGDFKFEEFFAGAVRGHGIVTDRFGRLRRTFVVDMVGHWEDGSFALDEYFRYGDGVAEERRWRVAVQGGGSYTAAADDIVGAAIGRAARGVIHWRYRLVVPIGKRRIAFDFDDRMNQVDADTVINVAEMRKFGIRAARVVLALRRLA